MDNKKTAILLLCIGFGIAMTGLCWAVFFLVISEPSIKVSGGTVAGMFLFSCLVGIAGFFGALSKAKDK